MLCSSVLTAASRCSKSATVFPTDPLPFDPLRHRAILTQEDTLKSYVFKVVVEEDEFDDGRSGFSASCPSLEGAYTWGNTREEALERIGEAVKLILDEMRDEGKPIPS